MKEKLREIRKEKGLTQAQVAKMLGVSTSAYSNYEQGLREPSAEMIKLFCKVFNISADYLLGIDE